MLTELHDKAFLSTQPLVVEVVVGMQTLFEMLNPARSSAKESSQKNSMEWNFTQGIGIAIIRLERDSGLIKENT